MTSSRFQSSVIDMGRDYHPVLFVREIYLDDLFPLKIVITIEFPIGYLAPNNLKNN